MARPLVSVITNTYNSGKYLQANMESMLQQSYSDWEHIVVDCGSTDSSLDILSQGAHDRLRVLRVPFCGVARGRNIGISDARGTIIAILDSDDVALPERLAEQVKAIFAMPNIVGIGSGMIRIDEPENTRKQYVYPSNPRQIEILLKAGVNPIPHSTFSVQLAALKSVGGYSNAIEKGEDFELFLRLSKKGALTSLRMPLVQCRSREDSHTNRHRPRGRDVSFYAAVSLILNSTSGSTQPLTQGMIETWLESIGTDGIGALLGKWRLRTIRKNWRRLDYDSLRYLVASSITHAPQIIRSYGKEWQAYSRTPQEVAKYLVSNQSDA